MAQGTLISFIGDNYFLLDAYLGEIASPVLYEWLILLFTHMLLVHVVVATAQFLLQLQLVLLLLIINFFNVYYLANV